MKQAVSETTYPVKFRKADSAILADHVFHRRSVELMGMKRVGINNFLRFFLFQKYIEKKYIVHDGKNLFVYVDLNDLVEHDLFAFWRLTLKRILDTVENHFMEKSIKDKISAVFLRCIQTNDFFLTYDGVKESLVFLTKEGFLPTLFLTRFDRLKDVASPEFFDNLKSIRDATGEKLVYVFTSFRKLSKIFPTANENELISRFVVNEYIQPLTPADQKIIFHCLVEKYHILATPFLEKTVLSLAGGHLQYLHLCIIIARELYEERKQIKENMLLKEIQKDERIMFLSEELWESLKENEQEVLKKVLLYKKISQEEQVQFPYLWKAGFILGKGKKQHLFNPLFTMYIQNKESKEKQTTIDLSKKEYALFQYLKKNLHEICEREKIAEIVWPESQEYGVSDWAIDRLVARLRNKLKEQESEYEVVTVRTRGYKLTIPTPQ